MSMKIGDNDTIVGELQDAGCPYIEILVRNDVDDSPLNKTVDRIALLVNSLMSDCYLNAESPIAVYQKRPYIFLNSLNYQINNLLEFRHLHFTAMFNLPPESLNGEGNANLVIIDEHEDEDDEDDYEDDNDLFEEDEEDEDEDDEDDEEDEDEDEDDEDAAKKDGDEWITPIPDAFKNAFD
tara:strand:- start:103 stop:645 length:543 start_codon:yes stop_codon:yes gene_type:complete